jgi:hypothetical protein
MKPPLISVLVLSYCAVAAQSANLPSFDEKMGVPELSLKESLKQNILPLAEELPKVAGPGVNPKRAAETAKIVSQMPIIIPKAEGGGNMPIVRPDSSVDHKMIVREPLLGSTGEVKLNERSERLANARQQREAALKQKRYEDEMREARLKEEAQNR